MLIAVLAGALLGTAAFLPSAHAKPASQVCVNTHAVAIGTSHIDYSYGSVWVTLDKLVDNVSLSFCGSIRNHSQVRLGVGQPQSGASPWHIGGTLSYGPDINHLSGRATTSYVTVTYSGSGKETKDAYGPWVPGNCGTTSAVFIDNNSQDMGDSGAFTGCAS